MKYLLAVLVLLMFAIGVFAGDPTGMVASPAIPSSGSLTVQGQCQNGVCKRVDQAIQNIAPPLRLAQPQFVTPMPSAPRRKFAPIRRLLGIPVD